ncbi:MAG: N-acetylmuramoyl-L-alanine amidase [Polyangiaceae bacterium]
MARVLGSRRGAASGVARLRPLSRVALTALLASSLPASADEAPSWPERPALRIMESGASAGERAPLRVFLDAGHGAEDNTGNRSSYCVAEQEFTQSLAEDVSEALTSAGLETRLSRQRGDVVSYAERVQAARDWNADVLISLHSDIRGKAEGWSPRAGVTCLRSRDAPGMSVLLSDAAPADAVTRSLAFATAFGAGITDAGFLAYDGATYGSDYAKVGAAGVFWDRHPQPRRIYMLHAAGIPAVLIETHNALDDREARLWDSPFTRQAFAALVLQSLRRAWAQPAARAGTVR